MQEYEDSNDFDEEDEDGTEEVALTQEINTLPVRDILEHSLGTRCICGPNVSSRFNTLIVIHNAFDKREMLEELMMGLDVDGGDSDSWVNLMVDI